MKWDPTKNTLVFSEKDLGYGEFVPREVMQCIRNVNTLLQGFFQGFNATSEMSFLRRQNFELRFALERMSATFDSNQECGPHHALAICRETLEKTKMKWEIKT